MKYVRGASATPYSEAVIVEWQDGVRGAINVGMDSPLALIRDVMRRIDETRYEEE